MALQASVPAAMAAVSGHEFDYSQLLCNETQADPSPEVKAALAEMAALLEAVSPDETEHDTVPSGHCDNCLTPPLAIETSRSQIGEPSHFIQRPLFFSAYKETFSYRAQGPPLGGRAPPHFS